MGSYTEYYSKGRVSRRKKAAEVSSPSQKDKLRRIPSKGWPEMIRKVYEVDLLLCPPNFLQHGSFPRKS